MKFFKNICIRLCTILITFQVIVSQSVGQVKIREIDSVFLHAQGDLLKYPDSAWSLSEKIRRWSLEISYDWGVLQSKLIKGLILYQKNELDNAAKALVEIIAQAEKMQPQSFEEALARTYLGFVYRRLGNLDKAMQNFERSAKIFEFMKEHSYHTENLNNYRYNDSIFNKEILHKYNNLRMYFETTEKEREIEALEKQRETDEKNQTRLIISIIAILILSVLLTGFLIYRHKKKQLILQNELKKGEQALQQQTLYMINLRNHIADIERRLKSMREDPNVMGKEVQGVLNNIFVNKSMEKEWKELEKHFSKIHPNFNGQLMKRHENLTQRERRLLALIKLDLNAREISRILCIEQRSVVMSRYRLKRKLGLEEKEDLNKYVQMFQ